MLHTMYYEDEVRKVEQFGKPDVDVRESEVKVAHQLIQALSGKFDPDKYHDSFEENLKELIKAHLEGRKVTPISKPKVAPVTDLMSALKQSLAQMKKPPQRAEQAQEAAETHARKRPSRKRAA